MEANITHRTGLSKYPLSITLEMGKLNKRLYVICFVIIEEDFLA